MRQARDLLNCWLVAMWFWGHALAVYPVAVRRSHVFALVPHFIATLPGRWRHFIAVEFIPPRHRRWTLDDFVLLFRGRYRVTEYRAVSVQWFNSSAPKSWPGPHGADALGHSVSPLYDAIRPLLRVAPADCHLFDRDSPREVLVFRERFGVWLSISSFPSAQRRDEYRAIEWGPQRIDDISGVHSFPSRWELLTWVSAQLLAVN